MAQIIKARVWQKVDTEANWNANPLILGAGEQAFVVNSAGLPINFKVGDGTKRFSQLPWSIQYAGGQYIQIVGNVLPAPGVDAGYSLVGPGTYTFSGQANIVAPEGRLSQLLWDGTSWSLVDMGELPIKELGVGEVKRENIAFGAVDETKTSFIEIGSTNLFDHNKVMEAQVVSSTTGEISPSASYNTSEHIPIEPSTQYTFYNARLVASYTESGIFISGVTFPNGLSQTYTTPANASTLRVSMLISTYSSSQMNLGASLQPYDEFFYKLSDSIKSESDLTELITEQDEPWTI